MKVTYIGNFNYGYCTEVHIAKTLRNLGVEVQQLQEDQLQVGELFDLASDSDVLLYTRTWDVAGRGKMIRTFRALEKQGVVTASYHLDLYLGIKREASLNGDPFWATQFVFTPDGDPASQERFEKLGIAHHFIRPGVFKSECVPGRLRRRWRKDVVFVGTVDGYHNEWPYRKQLHDWLKETYGSKYGKHGHPESVVRGQALNDLYASATVVVGDTLCPNFTKPYYWSDRVYETVGRGGFLIHPFIEGLDDEFRDGEHLRFYDYGDFDNLKSIIDHYRAKPREAREIAMQGQQHVIENCTYDDRLKEAFGIMGFQL